MAKELGSGVSGSIEQQKQKERKFIFLGLKIVMVAITVIFAGKSFVGAIGDYNSALESDARRGELERQYQTMQAEAAAWHEENDTKPDAVDDETGAAITEREMYSARAAGVELAALQNLYYQNKELLQADRQRLNELCRSTACWIGDGWDPAVTPIRWDFATFYDATDKTYDVCWQCWHQAPSGTMYLIAVQFASYDGEKGTFTMRDMYQTDFARMLNIKGAVEAGEPAEMDMTTQQLVGDLLQNGGTGSIPEGDPGQSAGVMNDLENASDDDGSDDMPDLGELAGGPAGGGN